MEVGRPVQWTCKRGHPRAPYTKCIPCRSLRDHMKYHGDEEYREKKKAHARAWKAAWKAEHGYSYSLNFDRKPKVL